MEPHKVVHFKKDCISCGACAAINPDFWEMDEQGFAQLKAAQNKGSYWERDLKSEEEKAINEETSQVCPVNIIHVKKKSN